MVDRVCNCNSSDVENFCKGLKKTTVRIVMLLSIIVYGWMSCIILDRMFLQCTKNWSRYDRELFTILYLTFSVFYFNVFAVIVKPLEYICLIMVGLYKCMRFCIRYIRKHVRLPTRIDFRHIFSIRAIDRDQSQPEISNSPNEPSDDRPPPLPPRNRVVVESRTPMFQKLTPKVPVRVKSGVVLVNKKPILSSSHLQRPQCSKQSAESSRRRGKKLTKRRLFKNMMSKVTNLQAISEEDLDQQGASGIKVPLSILTQNSSSDGETEKEASFTIGSYQYAAEGQDFDYTNIESGKQAPTQRVYGIEAQLRTSSRRDEQSDPDQIPENMISKMQQSVAQDSISQSTEQTLTSDYIPFLKLRNPTSSPKKLELINAQTSKFGTVAEMIHLPLSSFENLQQEQSLEAAYYGSQGEQMASGIQSSERLSELGSKSRVYDTDSIENQASLHKPLSSTCLQVSSSETQAQSSTGSVSISQEHSKIPHIQKPPEKGDQAVARYIKLPQLEEQFGFSEIITEKKQNSPELSAVRDVPISLPSQVSTMPGVQKTVPCQEQSSSAGVSDLQKPGRISDVQKRRLSRKHSPIPNYKKYSDSERQSQEETLNLLQPMQSRFQFYSEENQQQTSGIGDAHEHSSQKRGLQEKSSEGASAPRKSGTFNIMEKLRNLHKASATGFPVATSEIRHVGEDPTPTLLEDYAGEQFRGKAERATYQKRRGSLTLFSERPVRQSNTRTKKTDGFPAENISRLSESASAGLKTSSIQKQQILSSGCTPHSLLLWSGVTPTQAHAVTTPLKMEGDDQIGQKSYRSLSNLQEMYKVAAKRKASLTLALTSGGFVLRNDGAEEDETGAHSSEQSYMYDQPTDVLDVSDSGSSLSPKNISPSKEVSQNLDIPIRKSSSRTKRMKESIKSRPRLSACTVGDIQTFSVQSQQIEASRGGYTPRALSTSTQKQVSTTPPKEREDRTGKQSPSDPLLLMETYKEETKRKSCLTQKLAIDGLLLSKDGAENKETKADSRKTLFMYDQPVRPLDLTPTEVPFLPKCKGKSETQSAEERIRELSPRTCITEQSVESTSRLSACASGGVETSSIQEQQIEGSQGCYASHPSLPKSGRTPTRTRVFTTPRKSKEVEERIRQVSSGDKSDLKEAGELETEIKETFLTLDLATGGLVLTNEREEDRTDSSEMSFMYDQPTEVLDLTRIKAPSPPPKDKKASKRKQKRKN